SLPSSSSRTSTTASFTPPCSRSTPSTSPSSIRYPRTFTCRSARPIYSRFPSPLHRPRSPVRYIRSPHTPPYGFGTNLSAVSSPPSQPPRPPPAPPTYTSPIPPCATPSCISSNTYIRTFPIGLPIAIHCSPLPSPTSSAPTSYTLHPTVVSVGPYSLKILTSP